jgi:type I restriction enzyme, S subunit
MRKILLGALVKSGDITLGRGQVISKTDLERFSGVFPVYSSSAQDNGLFGTYGKFIFDEELISWSVDGGGKFFYRSKHKFSITNVSGFLRIENIKKFNYRFLYYLLDYQHSSLSFDYVDKAHPSVIQKQYFIPLLSIEHQQKIAEILSTIDRALEQTQALIAKYQRAKIGLMQDLLTRGIDEHGRLRHPDTHEFKDSRLGRIPVEWNSSHTLGEISHRITSGSRGWAAYYSEAGALFIRIGNLTRKHVNFRWDDIQFVDPPKNGEGSRTSLEPRDLLISITADLGIIGVVPDEGFGEAYINQHIALCRLDQTVMNPRFLGNLMQAVNFQNYFSQLNESGAKAGLNLGTVASLPVVIPSLKEQALIVSFIDRSEMKLMAFERQYQKYQSLKTGLMQDLLSGRRSVEGLLEESATMLESPDLTKETSA